MSMTHTQYDSETEAAQTYDLAVLSHYRERIIPVMNAKESDKSSLANLLDRFEINLPGKITKESLEKIFSEETYIRYTVKGFGCRYKKGLSFRVAKRGM